MTQGFLRPGRKKDPINAVFGALYEEDELLENHEPMTGPMTDLMAVWPKEKDGKLWLPDIESLPIRLDFEKIEIY